jgi:enolase-phosphatase E1
VHGSRLHSAPEHRVELKQVRAVLLDIEGTTTPIDFVHRTLFRYARARLDRFLRAHWNDSSIRSNVAQLRDEHAAEIQETPPAWADEPDAVVAYLGWLMDRDRKSTGLKSLQGKIWAEGYRAGELQGEVYPDVPRAMKQWRDGGLDIAIFSSGSVQAQQSLFSNTPAGDLTGLIRRYFDTTTGPKTAAESYSVIARALSRSPSEVLFLSDIVRELDAARAAGMQTALCLRESRINGDSGGHPIINSFDELNLEGAGGRTDTTKR